MEQLGKLGEEKNEEEEPATKRKKKCANLGLDLEERDEHVACHAAALALAMIYEEGREAEWQA